MIECEKDKTEKTLVVVEDVPLQMTVEAVPEPQTRTGPRRIAPRPLAPRPVGHPYEIIVAKPQAPVSVKPSGFVSGRSSVNNAIGAGVGGPLQSFNIQSGGPIQSITVQPPVMSGAPVQVITIPSLASNAQSSASSNQDSPIQSITMQSGKGDMKNKNSSQSDRRIKQISVAIKPLSDKTLTTLIERGTIDVKSLDSYKNDTLSSSLNKAVTSACQSTIPACDAKSPGDTQKDGAIEQIALVHEPKTKPKMPLFLLQNDPEGPVLPVQIGHRVDSEKEGQMKTDLPVPIGKARQKGESVQKGQQVQISQSVQKGQATDPTVAFSISMTPKDSGSAPMVTQPNISLSDLVPGPPINISGLQMPPPCLASPDNQVAPNVAISNQAVSASVSDQARQLSLKLAAKLATNPNPSTAKCSVESQYIPDTNSLQDDQSLAPIQPEGHGNQWQHLPEAVLVDKIMEITQMLKSRGSTVVNNNALHLCPFLKAVKKEFPFDSNDPHRIVISKTGQKSKFKVTSSYSKDIPVDTDRNTETAGKVSTPQETKFEEVTFGTEYNLPEEGQIKTEPDSATDSEEESMDPRPNIPLSFPLSSGESMVKSEDTIEIDLECKEALSISDNEQEVTSIDMLSSKQDEISRHTRSMVEKTGNSLHTTSTAVLQGGAVMSLLTPTNCAVTSKPVPLTFVQNQMTLGTIGASFSSTMDQEGSIVPKVEGDEKQETSSQVKTSSVDHGGKPKTKGPKLEVLAQNEAGMYAKMSLKRHEKQKNEKQKKVHQCENCKKHYYSNWSLKRHVVKCKSIRLRRGLEPELRDISVRAKTIEVLRNRTEDNREESQEYLNSVVESILNKGKSPEGVGSVVETGANNVEGHGAVSNTGLVPGPVVNIGGLQLPAGCQLILGNVPTPPVILGNMPSAPVIVGNVPNSESELAHLLEGSPPRTAGSGQLAGGTVKIALRSFLTSKQKQKRPETEERRFSDTRIGAFVKAIGEQKQKRNEYSDPDPIAAFVRKIGKKSHCLAKAVYSLARIRFANYPSGVTVSLCPETFLVRCLRCKAL